MRNKYIVQVEWESEELEVEANTREEAIEKAKDKCNMSPLIDNVSIINAEKNKGAKICSSYNV